MPLAPMTSLAQLLAPEWPISVSSKAHTNIVEEIVNRFIGAAFGVFRQTGWGCPIGLREPATSMLEGVPIHFLPTESFGDGHMEDHRLGV